MSRSVRALQLRKPIKRQYCNQITNPRQSSRGSLSSRTWTSKVRGGVDSRSNSQLNSTHTFQKRSQRQVRMSWSTSTCVSDALRPAPLQPTWAHNESSEVFFGILLQNAKEVIGYRALRNVSRLQRFSDSDDIISESIRRFLQRLKSPIDGVAEMSADRTRVYFNDRQLVFYYLRTIAKRCIHDVWEWAKKKGYFPDIPDGTAERDVANSSEFLSEIAAPIPSVPAQIKVQPPDNWVKALPNASERHEQVLRMRLNGRRRKSIREELSLSPRELTLVWNQIETKYQRLGSPNELLEAMIQ